VKIAAVLIQLAPGQAKHRIFVNNRKRLFFSEKTGNWPIRVPRVMRLTAMPEEETPRPTDSEAIRSRLKELSERSERLRMEAKKNADEAARIMKHVADLERRLSETEKRRAKKTSGRLG
jgi:hypothetical protein